ncbi:death domain-containing protein CRADD-like [Motacilla alba alba]|uniref:death domain-containing protein CRADD-like n=1 Tax=Motacilla alba alba TaxID=1094192 RepID=UPI0018D51C88|nr:death domain-containing protein CRADD-like [Motacilla alba alba]XP_038020340.1 death domain-containing protein CRADD-like [Motacilla alba alba]
MARDERATLLEVCQALPEDQLQNLKFLLGEQIPEGPLLPASRPDLCRILLQHFPGNSLRVIAGILRHLGRHDLIQRFQLPLDEQIPEGNPGTPNGDNPGVGGDSASGNHAGGIPAPPVSSRRLTEKELMKVAQKLGKEWQQVGIMYLELEQTRLEQIQEENPGKHVLWSFEMLREWHRRERDNATVSNLLACIEQAPVDPSILDYLRSLK